MTTIIYSLTLGCIIFVIVASSIQLVLIDEGNLGDINYSILSDNFDDDDDFRLMYASDVDPVIRQYQEYIEQWAYVTTGLTKQRNITNETRTSQAAVLSVPLKTHYAYPIGASPSPLLDSAIFTAYTNQTTSVGLTEQLYTATGS